MTSVDIDLSTSGAVPRTYKHGITLDEFTLDARAVPIIKPVPEPEPIPEPEPDPEPVAPASPKTSPDGPSGAAPVSDEEDGIVVKEVCGTFLERVLACIPKDSGDNSNSIGENPDEAKITSLEPDKASASEGSTTDFFTELKKDPETVLDIAHEYFEQVVDILNDTYVDDTILDTGTYNQVYYIKDVSLPESIDLNNGRQDVATLLGLANITIQPDDGKFLSFYSRTQSRSSPTDMITVLDPADLKNDAFLQLVWSADGKVVYNSYTSKDLDFTDLGPNRLPWFRHVMHAAAYRTSVNDPQALQAIAQVHIVNSVTVNTISSIFDYFDPSNKFDTITLSADATAGSDEAIAFDAFMRTDNGKGIYWLLATYHEALGNKRIKQVLLKKAVAERMAAALVVFGNTE